MGAPLQGSRLRALRGFSGCRQGGRRGWEHHCRGVGCVVLGGSLDVDGEEEEDGSTTAVVQSLSLLLSACRNDVTTCSPWGGVPSIKHQR